MAVPAKSKTEVKQKKCTLPMSNPSCHVTTVGNNKANTTQCLC